MHSTQPIPTHGVTGDAHNPDRSPTANAESDAPNSRLAVSSITCRIRVSDDVRYLTAGQVRVRFGGVSDMWLWRYMRDHGFPKPMRFGGKTSARHWLIADIEQWERQQIKKVAP